MIQPRAEASMRKVRGVALLFFLFKNLKALSPSKSTPLARLGRKSTPRNLLRVQNIYSAEFGMLWGPSKCMDAVTDRDSATSLTCKRKKLSFPG